MDPERGCQGDLKAWIKKTHLQIPNVEGETNLLKIHQKPQIIRRRCSFNNKNEMDQSCAD